MTARRPPKDCQICGDKTAGARSRVCPKAACVKENKRRRSEDYTRRKIARRIAAGEDYITCAECGERLLSLAHQHVVNIHGLSMAEYKLKHPDAPVLTSAVRHRRGASSRANAAYLTYDGAPLDSRFFEFLTGSLLGDGSLEMGKRNGRYAEGGANEEYLRWKGSFLASYIPCSCKEKLSAPHSKSGKRYLGWWVKSCIHPVLTEWRHRWYPDGVKVVPFDLLEKHLTPFALAVWFCDDGHKTVSCDGSFLYTHSFTEEEVDKLLTVLEAKFQLTGKKRKVLRKQQYFIYLGAEQWPRLRTILNAADLPGMAYKLKSYPRLYARNHTPLTRDRLLLEKPDVST